MYAPGHVAAALMASAPALRWWAVAGALAPDVVDKPVAWALGGFSRSIGHSALVWLCLVGGAAVSRSERARAVALGVATHLIADLVDDVFYGLFATSQVASSWMLWPVARPDAWAVTLAAPVLSAPYAPWVVEGVVVALAVAGLVGSRDGRRA
jgi:hypothetical protein